jgi:DNA polymerase I
MSDASPKTLYLIDGYAAIFRAYYAIRNPLFSPTTGEPTQAVLVFAQMLLKLYTTFRPDYVAVAWDAPGETFREEIYAAYVEAATHPDSHLPTQDAPTITETPRVRLPVPIVPESNEATPPVSLGVSEPPRYKGTRRATPDALTQQVGRIQELLDLFSIPVIGKSGLEADDVIATLVDRVQEPPAYPDLRIRIVSRDKDLEQLLSERVTLFDIHTGSETDVAALREKRGIAPEQVVDLLTLTGDTVDNVPGVNGIGPRTAAKLLQQFGSLDAMMERLPEVKEAWRESLAKARPLLPLSRQLLTLRRDPEITFSLEEACVRPISTEPLLRFFDELGFSRIKEQVTHLPQ